MNAKEFLKHKGIFDTQYIVDCDGESIELETLLIEYQALQLQQTGVIGNYLEKDMDNAYDKGFKDAMLKYRTDL